MTWASLCLKRVARISYGLSQPPTLSEAGVPILRATNITHGQIISDGMIYAVRDSLPLDRVPLLREGEILVVRSGAYTGDSALITRTWAGCTPGYDLRVSPTGAHPPYIAYFLQSSFALDQISLMSTRAAQPHLNAENLSDITIRIPPLAEQHRIADFLDALTGLMDRLRCARDRQMAALAELASSTVSAIVPDESAAAFVRLGYLATVQMGITVDSRREPRNDSMTLPYLRVANVQDGYVDLESVSEITVPIAAARSAMLKCGDVLMTEGGDLDKLGRGTIWLDEIQNCLHQNHVFAVRTDQRKLHPEYLALITRTAYARSYFERTGTKTTNLASTSSSKIRDFRVPLIDIADQIRICREMDERLKDIRKLQAALTRQRVLLVERRQALITAAVTGQIDVTTTHWIDAASGIDT